MGKTHLIDYDPLTKVRRLLHIDGDEYHYENVQDVEGRLELNRELRKEQRPMGDVGRVASVPFVAYEKALREGHFDTPAKTKAWLNDRDQEPFRTREGRV